MNLRALALGTVVVAFLDIAEVIVFYALRGVKPVRILQSVATGILGRASFEGGMKSAALGLLLHTFIAFVVVLVYHLAATRLPVLTQRPILCGATYGLIVYAFMNFVVLPLSAAGPPKFTAWLPVVNGLFAHLFCVGIPAAFSTRWGRVSRPLAGTAAILLVLAAAGCATVTPMDRLPLTHASGTFDVKLTPQGTDPMLGRMTIDKTFHGDLEGTSQGEMLTAGTAVQGSAGYVAIERISGTLQGRTGTFVLQHSGTMTRGAPALTITVVPDSGTGELTGILGRMNIDLSGGNHAYTFDYALPAR